MSIMETDVPDLGTSLEVLAPAADAGTIGSNWAERTAEYVRAYQVRLDADEVVCLASALWLEAVGGARPRLAGVSPVALEQLCAQLQWGLVAYRNGCPTMLYTVCMRTRLGKRMLMKVDEAALTGGALTGKPVYALADRVHGLGDLPDGSGPVLARRDEIEAELDFGGGVRRRVTLGELLRVWKVDADEMSCEWHMVLPCHPTPHPDGRRMLARSALVRQFHLLNARFPDRASGLHALIRMREALAMETDVDAHRRALRASFPALEGERADMGRLAFARGVRALGGGAFEGVARAAGRASAAWLALRALAGDETASAAALDEGYEEVQDRERTLLDALARVAGGAS
jgi:hypothetical protein